MPMKELILPASGPTGPFDEGDLTKLSVFVAGGFGALTAVLTFFGIKEGVLDRVLQAESTASMFVFCLIGFGLLCGILAPAFASQARVYLALVLIIVTVLGYLLTLVLDNFDQDEKSSALTTGVTVALEIAAVIAVVVFALIRAKIPLTAAVLMLGVAATSMGLYGVAKISVMSKVEAVAPRIAVEMLGDDKPQLTMKVKAARRGADKLAIKLVGTRAGEDTDLGGVLLTPDGVGAIDETVTFPVVASAWTTIAVHECESTSCANSTEVIRLSGGAASKHPQVSGSIERGDADGLLKESLHAYGMPKEGQLEVAVFRERGGQEPTMLKHAMLEPAADGTVAWSSAVLAGMAGDRLILEYRTCQCMPCAGDRTKIASYLMPAD